MAKYTLSQKLLAGWRPVLSPDFWFWTFPRQPVTSLGILTLLVISLFTDVLHLRVQGDPLE